MATGRPISPTPSQLPPLPGSPSYSFASTANPLSAYSLPPPPPPRPGQAGLTRSDIEHSEAAYDGLVSTAKAYRVALAALSTAASAFGGALEACARLKEARAEPVSHTPRGGGHGTVPSTPAGGPPPQSSSSAAAPPSSACTADLLMSAAGMQFLIANHQQIVSETVYRSFELPLMHELDKWRRSVDDEKETYRSAVASKSAEIRRLERDGLPLHRHQRPGDASRYRAHLVDLTTRLDGLMALHSNHSRTLLRESQETSAKILDASCSLVRAEVDIYESLARKGWSGGGLEDLLERGVDLFASEPDDQDANADSAKLFSILPPKSILADTSDGVAVRPTFGHHHHHSHTWSDSLLDTYQSLTAAVATENRAGAASAGGDADSTASDFARPRNPGAFSPQPIRRVPTDVTYDDSLAVGAIAAGGGPMGSGVATPTTNNPMTMSLSLSLSSGTRDDDDDEEEDEDNDNDAYEAGTIRGARSSNRSSAGSKSNSSDDDDDEQETSTTTNNNNTLKPDAAADGTRPWRSEGLRRSYSSELGKALEFVSRPASDSEDEAEAEGAYGTGER